MSEGWSWTKTELGKIQFLDTLPEYFVQTIIAQVEQSIGEIRLDKLHCPTLRSGAQAVLQHCAQGASSMTSSLLWEDGARKEKHEVGGAVRRSVGRVVAGRW